MAMEQNRDLVKEAGTPVRSSSLMRSGSAMNYSSNKSMSQSGLMRHESRVIAADEITDQHTLLGEQVVQSEMRVPRRRMKEEVVEHVVVVPERRLVEEVVEETVMVREKIVEVAKPVVRERLVEVPQIEYRDKVIEVEERIIEERVKRVPKIQIEERIKEVPKVITKEKVVEVPEYEYREIPVERIVEVPEIHEEIVTREVAVDEFIEVPVPELKTVEIPQDVERYIPLPKESTSKWEFRVPHLKPKFRTVNLPIYAPRFIEVPLPSAYFTQEELKDAKEINDVVRRISANPYPSLCEIEKLAEYAKSRHSALPDPDSVAALQSALEHRLADGSPLDNNAFFGGIVGANVCKPGLGPRYGEAVPKPPILGHPTSQGDLKYLPEYEGVVTSTFGTAYTSTSHKLPRAGSGSASRSVGTASEAFIVKSPTYATAPSPASFSSFSSHSRGGDLPSKTTGHDDIRVSSTIEAAKEISAASGIPVKVTCLGLEHSSSTTVMPDGTEVDEAKVGGAEVNGIPSGRFDDEGEGEPNVQLWRPMEQRDYNWGYRDGPLVKSREV